MRSAASAVPTVEVRPRAVVAVRRGHPWVYRDQLTDTPSAPAGQEVRVVGPDGATLGHGLFEPDSPIAVRLWTRGDASVSDGLLEARLDRALAWRTALFPPPNTTAYRLVHGEGDRTPGFVVDRYEHVAVLRTDGDAAARRVDWFVRALWPRVRATGVTVLALRAAGARPVAIEGTLPETVDVREHGVPLRVDLVAGQKTGAFLDQRENRVRVGALARGRRVLNLFSYQGGFSLTAALGGAVHTTSVDLAARAHATAQVSFRLAGVDPAKHAFVTADAFTFLDQAGRAGKTWDLVVSDPPSFAPSEKARPSALASYRRLHRACAAVLAPGGILCAGSCSSHVDATAFLATLDDDALGRADLCLRETFGPPADHPTLPGWPEGRYLKFAVLS